MIQVKDFRSLNQSEMRNLVGGMVPLGYLNALWKIGVSGYKHRNDIMRSFDKGFNKYPN